MLSGSTRVRVIVGLLASPCTLTLAVPTAAIAKPLARNITISAGPLEPTLLRFASATNVQLLYDPVLVRGKNATAVAGRFTPAQAIAKMLAGTGLRATSHDGRTFSIARGDPDNASGRAASRNTLHTAYANIAAVKDEPPVIVTGIRASLRKSVSIKRTANGVIDAISAEEIGKFPDTNLAESLQRITGVSIDRSNGEGSLVTVRGFGPDFNLVTLNGRQFPTSTFTGSGAPSARAFDFGNFASEGVAAVEVFKTGRASIPSGGIGSTVNIRTPRPLDQIGFRGIASVKGVRDTSQDRNVSPTPELAAIISKTFGDDRYGILLTGIFQKRRAANNLATAEWRDGYLGSENNWGSLPMAGDPRYDDIVNRPGPDDVYEVPQSVVYSIGRLNRRRVNGQLVLQARPVDSLTATIDYTYARNSVANRSNNVGIWFNFNDVSSEWTDGPVAGPIFYAENFQPNERQDLALQAETNGYKSVNKSLGGNVRWTGLDRFSFTLDAHHSTAESKPPDKHGTKNVVGLALFGIARQSVNFDLELPVVSLEMHPGQGLHERSLIWPSGSQFHNSYFKDRIDQVQLAGTYDPDWSFLENIDFGVSHIDNKVRSAFGMIQNDTWNGAGRSPEDLPDSLFDTASIPDAFEELEGGDATGILPFLYTFRADDTADLLDDLYQICGGDRDCRADFFIDRRIREKTLAAYWQARASWSMFSRPANLVAGVRLERTKIDSRALGLVPVGTSWNSANEFSIIYSGETEFTRRSAKYNNWLPAIDFDIAPWRNVKLRASYSQAITRADYTSLQGGGRLTQVFRVGGGFAEQGNPGLLPFKSRNVDLSAEWHYGRESYVSIGYFRKNVSNFISSSFVREAASGLRTPFGGPRYQAAIAALGPAASMPEIRDYILDHYPESSIVTGQTGAGLSTGSIFGLPEDPLVTFEVNSPVNGDQKATLHGVELAFQHNFGASGFGMIANYTKVSGDASYNNALPAGTTQFALVGLSDSANFVGFYDKRGIQARIAYNWRDKFLAAGGDNPNYVERYGQLDASASFELRRGVTVFIEGINITGESRRAHRRSRRNVTFVSPGHARYAAGIRYAF